MRATRFSRGTLGVAGVLCLGLSGLGATALAAPSGPGNIDFDKADASITINKHVKDEAKASPGNAKGDDKGVKGAPVADVVFTAYKLEADLKQNEAWTNLSTLVVPGDACGADYNSPAAAVGSFNVSKADPKVFPATDQAGVATTNVPVGAYLVCETQSPANVTEKAAPFVVTVPFPNTAENKDRGAGNNSDGTWLYNVTVYPKNVLVNAPTKGVKVNAAGIKTGEQVEFPVTATVPTIADDRDFKYFMVSDPMSADLTELAVKSVVLVDPTGAAQEAEVPAGNYTKTTNGAEINVSFNEAGLGWLKANAMGKQIKVTFTAKVANVNAKIDNVANFYVDSVPKGTPTTPPTTPPGKPVPSNKVVTAWGGASIFKQDKQSSLALEGATFEVYAAKDPWADTCKPEIADSDNPDTGFDETKPVSINNVSQFKSTAEGKIDLDGLFVDSKVGAGDADVAVDHQARCYVVKEISAPAGYVLPTGNGVFTPLKVTAGSTTEAGKITVDNTKTTVPQLPLTGAAGKILMTVGGLSLMAIAVGFVLAARKRRVNEA